MSVERTLEAQGARKILDCIRSDQNNALLKHNYYNDKFDCTGMYLYVSFVIFCIYVHLFVHVYYR